MIEYYDGAVSSSGRVQIGDVIRHHWNLTEIFFWPCCRPLAVCWTGMVGDHLVSRKFCGAYLILKFLVPPASSSQICLSGISATWIVFGLAFSNKIQRLTTSSLYQWVLVLPFLARPRRTKNALPIKKCRNAIVGINLQHFGSSGYLLDANVFIPPQPSRTWHPQFNNNCRLCAYIALSRLSIRQIW